MHASRDDPNPIPKSLVRGQRTSPPPKQSLSLLPWAGPEPKGGTHRFPGTPRTAQPCWREITGQDADSSCSLGQSPTSAALQQVLWVQVEGQAAPEPPWEAHEPQQKAELGMPITTGGTQVTQPPLHTGDKGQMV